MSPSVKKPNTNPPLLFKTVVQAHGQNIAGEIIPPTCDITCKSAIASLVKEIESREKWLCILINNAGIATANRAPIGETGQESRDNLFEADNASFDLWADEYRTNVAQLYFMTTAFPPLLEKATEHQTGFSSTVINITSISGSVLKSQGHFSYNASKGAANHLAKMLASEVSSHGMKVRIDTIAPRVFSSEMTAGESKDNMKSEVPKEKYDHLPARRPGNDRDMASAVLFFATN